MWNTVWDRALETIAKNLDREVAKNKISARIRRDAGTHVGEPRKGRKLAACDLVVEEGRKV